MDEILASIRRIIESNDPVPSVMPEPDGFSGSAANDDVEDVPLTIDEVFAPRAEVIETQPRGAYPQSHDIPAHEAQRPVVEAPSQQPKSLSLADVAARVRAASDRNPGLRDLTPRVESHVAAPIQPPMTSSSPLMTSRMAAAGGERLHDAPRVARDDLDTRPSAESIMMDTAAPTIATDVETQAEALSGAIEDAAPVALISADAGQQVARSFQDLAVAVDQAERRSYDEIAAELLRPMLQEWLDENLPTLVERLVREEIERVARGNRR
jgi:cell pole-organizing protein PopZ